MLDVKGIVLGFNIFVFCNASINMFLVVKKLKDIPLFFIVNIA